MKMKVKMIPMKKGEIIETESLHLNENASEGNENTSEGNENVPVVV
jgi:hypothetical protein